MEKIKISKTALIVSYAYLLSIPVVLLASAYFSNPIMELLIFLFFVVASIAIPIICWKDLRRIFRFYKAYRKLLKSKI